MKSQTSFLSTVGLVLAIGLCGCSQSGADEDLTASTAAASTATDDHGDDARSATLLPVPASLVATIDAPGDSDWFATSLEAGGKYTFSVYGFYGMEPVLRLVAPDGSRVLDEYVQDGPIPIVRLTHRPTSSGTYYVQVAHRSPTASLVDYQIVTQGSAPAAPAPEE